MGKFLCAVILVVGGVQAQVAVPSAPGTNSQKTALVAESLPSASTPTGKVGLVRGVVKRLDPIHDELLIHAFGGGDLRIAFDPQTQFLSGNTRTRLTSVPVGSVVSIDTVINGGKLLAVSVQTGSSHAAELTGQVERYDPGRSRLIVRDPMSPEESISLRVTPSTIVVSQGRPAAPQILSPGMLVQVWFSPTQNTANKVAILAARGDLFTFEGRIVAVDLRTRTLVLSNDSDESIREIALGPPSTMNSDALREGAQVSIQAEFDGDRYNERTLTLVPQNP